MSTFVNPLEKFQLRSSPPPAMARPATRQSSVGSARINTEAKFVEPPASTGLRTRQSRYVSESVSPPRKRTTRSQSRELQAAGVKSLVDDVALSTGPAAAGFGRRGKGKGRVNGKELAVVEEESPVRSARKSMGHSVNDTVIPESPDTANISGTTFLPTDSEPETGDLDPIMMVEALPDLHRAATSVLDFLVPASQSQASVIDLAKKLRDPKSSQTRRLDRLRSNFLAEAKYFGNQTYIEVGLVTRALPSVKVPGTSGSSQARRWHPDGILYKANCARFALETLASPGTTGALEQVIYDLEGKFPLPFMNALIFHGTIKGATVAGKSSLHQATFDLALDIRTQFLKIKLEARKFEDFDPEAIIAHVFFSEPLADEDESEELALRGFNLPSFQDDDGCLPDDLKGLVDERVRHIRRYFIDDHPWVDFEGLDAAYPWREFLASVARWTYQRDDEINHQLKNQPAVEDVRDLLEQEINRRGSFSDPVQEHSQEKVPEPDIVDRAPVDEIQPQQRRKELLPAAEIDVMRRSSKGPFLSFAAIKQLSRRESRLHTATQAPESSQQSDLAGFVSQHAARESTAGVPSRTVIPEVILREPPRDGPSVSMSPDLRRTIRRPAASRPEQVTIADSQWEITLNDDDWDIGASPQRSKGAPSDFHDDNTPSRNRARESIVSLPSSQQILAAARQHKASSVRDRPAQSFIDRQANARRVSPINLDSQTPIVETSNARKRKRAVSHDEESEDEDIFSQDQRAIDVGRRRAQKPTLSPSKRARFFDDEESEDGAERQLQSTLDETVRSSPAKTSSAQVVASEHARSSQHRPHHRSNLREVLEQLSSLGGQPEPPRLSRPHHTSPRSREPESRSSYADTRVRKRWTEEENERLISLIGQYGVSWAELKRKDDVMDSGPKLEHRDQVQLKDRARNIKIEYIRNGLELPNNFDKVNLKKTDIQRLKAIGREVP